MILRNSRGKSTFDLQLINAVMSYYSIYGLFKFGPAVDLEYVPRLPGQLLLDDTNHKGIPMILGHTSLDGLLFTPPRIRDDETLGQYLSELYPRAPDSLFETVKKDNYYGIPDKKETLEITKINTVSNLWDDIAISCNNHYLTNAAVKNDSATPVWRYLFSAKPATHGLDVPFTVRSPFYRLPSYFVPSFFAHHLVLVLPHRRSACLHHPENRQIHAEEIRNLHLER